MSDEDDAEDDDPFGLGAEEAVQALELRRVAHPRTTKPVNLKKAVSQGPSWSATDLFAATFGAALAAGATSPYGNVQIVEVLELDQRAEMGTGWQESILASPEATTLREWLLELAGAWMAPFEARERQKREEDRLRRPAAEEAAKSVVIAPGPQPDSERVPFASHPVFHSLLSVDFDQVSDADADKLLRMRLPADQELTSFQFLAYLHEQGISDETVRLLLEAYEGRPVSTPDDADG